jgi:hypothetical protein
MVLTKRTMPDVVKIKDKTKKKSAPTLSVMVIHESTSAI